MQLASPNGAPTFKTSPAEPISAIPWHVLYVRSNFEKRVANSLEARSIETYLPLYSERVRWTDRTVITERPLFPAYLFARFLRGNKVAVISTPGVVRTLGDEQRNLVTCAELDRIRVAIAEGLNLRPHRHLVAGMAVKVRSGIFQGVEGTVVELRQQCKVVIGLAAVRQCFSLEIDINDLEILNDKTNSARIAS
jgi:transcription antitermination factor NusG